MTSATVTIPGYKVGTWDIDPVHSDISITARHFGVSKVRGSFHEFSGEIVTTENPLESSVNATIKAASIDTKQEQRDEHIRSADFLDVASHETITFTSTAVRPGGDDGFLIDGDLTIRGVTKQVTLEAEVSGFGPDPFGGYRAGFSAITTVNRKDFAINFNAVMETGGLVVSDKLTVSLEIEAILRKTED